MVIKKAMSSSHTLADLPKGGTGTVATVGGDPRLRRRLLEMGLTPGCPLTLVRRAPLGDPLVFNLRGYDLSLRSAEARLVGLTTGDLVAGIRP